VEFLARAFDVGGELAGKASGNQRRVKLAKVDVADVDLPRTGGTVERDLCVAAQASAGQRRSNIVEHGHVGTPREARGDRANGNAMRVEWPRNRVLRAETPGDSSVGRASFGFHVEARRGQR